MYTHTHTLAQGEAHTSAHYIKQVSKFKLSVSIISIQDLFFISIPDSDFTFFEDLIKYCGLDS
jgi:hypothetical protein